MILLRLSGRSQINRQSNYDYLKLVVVFRYVKNILNTSVINYDIIYVKDFYVIILFYKYFVFF